MITDVQKKAAIIGLGIVVTALCVLGIAFLAYLHDQKVYKAGYQKAVNEYEERIRIVKEAAEKQAAEIRTMSQQQATVLQTQLAVEREFSEKLLKHSPKVITIQRDGKTVCTSNSSDTLDPAFIQSYNQMGDGK